MDSHRKILVGWHKGSRPVYGQFTGGNIHRLFASPVHNVTEIKLVM